MKKHLILLVFLTPLLATAQLSTYIEAAKNYTDANIINNNLRMVTPLKVNTSISKVLDALKYIDTAKKFNTIPTWQQTLNTPDGKILTSNNFIEGDNKSFVFDNFSEFTANGESVSFKANTEGYLYGPFWEVNKLLIANQKFLVRDSATFKGYGLLSKKFNYASNINGNFDDLSLVSKKYVDSLNNIAIANSWGITGNSGTVDGTNFIGTTDNVPFNIRVNNQKAGRIDLTNSFFGYRAGNSNTSGFGNVALGNNALFSNTNGANNVMLGRDAGYSNTSGFNNVAVGRYALYSNAGGNQNTAIGWGAMFNNTSGIRNIALGVDALAANTTGENNTASGSRALYINTTGNNNTAYGVDALLNTSGSDNTAIGARTFMFNESGSKNTAIGANSEVASNNLTNATAIGANAFVSQSNSLILGSIDGENDATANTNVGIGTTAPSERLHVVGNLRLVNGSEGAGKVLVSDANGVTSWSGSIAVNKLAALTPNMALVSDNDGFITTSSITSTQIGYLSGIASPLTTMFDGKVTKGGDAGAIAIGTTNNNDLTIRLNNTDRWVFDGANGYLRRGNGTSSFGLQFYGTGAGSTVTFGDLFDVSTPYIMIRERNGTDTDQGQIYSQKGAGIFTGTLDNNPDLWVDQTGRTVIGGETAVTGNALSVIGSSDISGNLNVQGNGTFGSFVKYKTSLTPTTPANGTECNLYFKSNKLVIQYNDAGTTRYKYLDLNGTGVTWIHTTVAP